MCSLSKVLYRRAVARRGRGRLFQALRDAKDAAREADFQGKPSKLVKEIQAQIEREGREAPEKVPEHGEIMLGSNATSGVASRAGRDGAGEEGEMLGGVRVADLGQQMAAEKLRMWAGVMWGGEDGGGGDGGWMSTMGDREEGAGFEALLKGGGMKHRNKASAWVGGNKGQAEERESGDEGREDDTADPSFSGDWKREEDEEDDDDDDDSDTTEKGGSESHKSSEGSSIGSIGDRIRDKNMVS